MLTIELPEQAEQTAFNARRWAEILADPKLFEFEGRIETDRYGQIIMSPPAAPRHSNYQGQIVCLLKSLMRPGKVMPECPVSTADGVRSADAAWMTFEAWHDGKDKSCFTTAPEICVEIMSPDNSERQIRDKAALYFDAGAQEVWICDRHGAMIFLETAKGRPMRESKICPLFPTQLED